jgi:hypothetical protein
VSLYKALVSQGCSQAGHKDPSPSRRSAQEVNTVATCVCRLQSDLCEYCGSFGQLRRQFTVAVQDEVVTELQTACTSKSP